MSTEAYIAEEAKLIWRQSVEIQVDSADDDFRPLMTIYQSEKPPSAIGRPYSYVLFLNSFMPPLGENSMSLNPSKVGLTIGNSPASKSPFIS